MTLIIYLVLLTGGFEIERHRVAGLPHCKAKGVDIVRQHIGSTKYWAVYFECRPDQGGEPA